MKTAISIPDKLFKQADRLAKKQKKSRSQLYADAVAEYLARYDDDTITEAYNQMADEMDDEELAFVRKAARRTIERVEW